MRLDMRPWLLASLWFAVGCGSPSVEGDLMLIVAETGELQVDTVCEPECIGQDGVSAQLAYVSSTRPQDDIVELEQYRVDFTLHGVSGKVPYFAAKRSVKLQPGGDESVTLQVVGSAQRDFVQRAAHGHAVSATAKLEFAGYDFDNRQVFVDTEFDVRFEDIIDTRANPDAGVSDAQ